MHRPRRAAAGNNNSYVMGYVDADADATTIDSSSATVALPAGATVVWAGLYWAADTTAGAGVGRADAANRGTVRFKAGAGAYQPSPPRPPTCSPPPRRPRATARSATSPRVAAAGSGTYTVANVQTGTGNDRFAGWALFVAYRDTAQPIRRLTSTTASARSTRRTPSRPPSRRSTRRRPAPVTTKAGLLDLRGRRRPRDRDRGVQRPRADRRAQPGQQRR